MSAIFYLVTFVGFTATVALCIYLFLKIRNYERATMFSLSNTLDCGTLTCPMDPVELPVPDTTTTPEQYSATVARYCADLILRVENAYTASSPVVIPSGLQDLCTLFSDKSSKLAFGKMFWEAQKGTLFLVFRGSQTVYEWMHDIDFRLSGFVPKKASKHATQSKFSFNNILTKNIKGKGDIRVHTGFLEIFEYLKPLIDQTIARLVDPPRQIICTGHSVGAAIAVLAAVHCRSTCCYVYALPRMGNPEFAAFIDGGASSPLVFKHVNTCDGVPSLPASVCPNFKNIKKPFFFNDFGKTLSFTRNYKSMTLNHLLVTYIRALDENAYSRSF